MRKILAATLLAMVACVGIAKAQQAPITASYMSFEGGLNNFQAPIYLADNESPDLMNVVIDEPLGTLVQRNGFKSCGNTPSGNTATALFEYSLNNGARYLIVSDNVNIWQTADCVVYNTVATGLSAQSTPRFATIQNKLWATNGSDYPIVWDATTASVLDGQSGRPLGIKGKLITYWKSRVWIGNTTAEPSGLYFSQLTDVNGAALNPATSTMAWANALNLIYFQRDDGSPLYGVKVYHDNLYAFKETGIMRLVFQDEFNLNTTKSVSVTGSKFQESIQEMDDGLLRFVGKDGVYAFDGSMVKRISTKWTPTFYALKQPSHSEQYKLWDTNTDFNAGSFSNTELTQFPDSVSLTSTSASGTIDAFADGDYTNTPTWTCVGGSGDCARVSVAGGKLYVNGTGWVGGAISAFSTPNPLSFRNLTKYYYLKMYSTGKYTTVNMSSKFYLTANSANPTDGYYLQVTCAENGEYNGACTAYLYSRTSSVDTLLGTDALTVTGGADWYTECNPIVFSYKNLNGASKNVSANAATCGLSMSYDVAASIYASTTSVMTFDFTRGDIYVDDITQAYDKLYPATGSFTSQVSTATGLTVWKTFDAAQATNGQTVNYFIRTGLTAAAAASATWVVTSPGVVVSSTTQSYAQWMANLSTSDLGITPILNSSSIGWVTGDATKSPLTAMPYKSRYWLSGSTTAGNDYNDIVMVESKSPLGTYTRYNLPLSAMVLWNNLPYGAISNTSKIARLDYSATDDESAITSYWNSKDDIYKSPLNYKTVSKAVADYSNVPSNPLLEVGISRDFGVTYSTRIVDTGAFTQARNTKILNYDSGNSLQVRTRVKNSTLGVGFKLYGLYNMGTMNSFIGDGK